MGMIANYQFLSDENLESLKHYDEEILEDIEEWQIDNGEFKSDKKITSEDFISALYIHNICFNLQGEDTDFMLDLAAERLSIMAFSLY